MKDLKLSSLRFVPIQCPLCGLMINCHKENILHALACTDCMNYCESTERCMLDLMVADQDNDHCECTEYDLRKALYFMIAENNMYIEEKLQNEYKK